MIDLAGHLGGLERSGVFDAFERAATSVGLALFLVRIDAAPPTVIYASGLLAQFVGRPLRDIVGRPPWELVAPAQQQSVREIILSRGPGAAPLTFEFAVERPDGTRREMEVGVARITTPGAELSVCYFRDTTVERTAYAALHRSEARFRSLIENAPDGVVILQQGRIVLANPVAVRMFGETTFEAVRGRALSEWLPPDEAARAAQRIAQIYAGAVMQPGEYTLRRGLVVEVQSVRYEYDDKPAILTFVRDVTERRRIQDQLFRSDRLAALGGMAATVAHEINNPLTYIQLHLQALAREVALDPDPARATKLGDHADAALHGVERVARIVHDLRAYSRDSGDEPDVPVDAVAVVQRALQMVEHDLRHRAELVRWLPDEPALINGSAGRLEQVVINLLVNASQALTGPPGANRITVDVGVGDDVTISITDTGHGIAEPDRVFEAFFTTKPVGEGTGLGLFVCKQLVERMRGRIEIVRTGPSGTTFAVVLPRRREMLARPVVVAAPVSDQRLRVLVIDDEPAVRNVTKALLATEHEVESAGDGEAALALAAATDFDVILCDLMMPHMNGRDVYEQIRGRWPGRERRVVFVTGGAFLPHLASFLDSIDNLKLRKPFTIDQALAIVRDAHQRVRG